MSFLTSNTQSFIHKEVYANNKKKAKKKLKKLVKKNQEVKFKKIKPIKLVQTKIKSKGKIT